MIKQPLQKKIYNLEVAYQERSKELEQAKDKIASLRKQYDDSQIKSLYVIKEHEKTIETYCEALQKISTLKAPEYDSCQPVMAEALSIAKQALKGGE